MRGSVRRLLVVGLAVGTAGLAVSPVVAMGEGSPPAEGTGTSSWESSLLSEVEDLQTLEEAKQASPEASEAGSPSASPSSGNGTGASLTLDGSLVVPEVQPLEEGEGLKAQEEARRHSPEAVVAREESQLKYSGLNSGEAGKVTQEVFPSLVNEPAGGPPALPAGESISRFPAVNVAQIDGGSGKHSVIESTAPMAVQSTHGLVPVDLSLTEEGGAFKPKTPLVDVQIPKQLNQGISLANTGVSLVPVDEQGSPLGGAEGSVDGVTVMYANTQTDADTLVKPTTRGFEMDTVLRSIDSPTQLAYKVQMPQGASLVEDQSTGSVQVVDEGATIAQITAPTANDAEGTPVPLSMKITSGDILSLTVESFTDGRYKLPIIVDPEAEDPVWSNGYYGYKTEWYFEHVGSLFTAPEHPEGGSWTESISSGHANGEWGGIFYTTRGASQITRSHAEGHWNDAGSSIHNYMVLYTPTAPNLEDYDPLPEYSEEEGVEKEEPRIIGGYACAPALSCPETIAGSAPPENNNTAAYEQEAYAAGEGHSGENTVTNAYVDISQEKGPELEFNKTNSTIYNTLTKEYIPNVLYGTGSWLGPHSGAFEVRAKDPGVGLSLYRVLTSGWGDEKYYYDDEECFGIQCPEYNDQGYTYKTGMADGEASFEALAEDYVGLYKDIYPQKIKVDATPPHGIKIVGLQNGNELPVGEPSLSVEATDGEGTTKSSGMKSIKVSVEGHEVAVTAASCPEGPCTASTKFTLASRDYSSGQHTMVVTATDNADNVAQEEFTFRVHGAGPVSVGPGSVDPSTGQLTLSATDVSLGGAGGVSRTYQSRDLTAGAEGPLGPQWAINLGGSEGLTVQPNGSVILDSGNSGETTFALNKKGELESPKGDSNLKLEAKEKEPGKGITEYVLSDAAAGTKTKFEQPKEAQSITPMFASSFGSEAGQLKHPISDAIDSSGNVWVASNESDLIEKFSSTGTLMDTYGSEGIGDSQFIGPRGIGINQTNGDVYVADEGDNRIEELSSSGAFIEAFGWGVSNGHSEFEICTKECEPGIAGSGNGQFSTPKGVVVDSSGNVWISDYYNNRIEEFNEKGEYKQKFGTEGKGEGQFKDPIGIAFSGGNLYVSEMGNDRVQELSTAGKYIYAWGKEGTGNSEFKEPRDIAVESRTGNLYVADTGNDRVQEFSSAGKFIVAFGSAGTGAGQLSEPKGVAVSSSGGIYVTDLNNNRVEEWARPQWVPTEAGGALAASSTTYTYTTVEEEGKAVIEPKEALASIPAGVSSCTPLVAGCRALTFEYATATTATGENPSEWGNYKGHLEKVWFHAYSTSVKEVTKIEVARYKYDGKGRLRVEWDPRIETSTACGKTCSALKTTYGYDTEGHVTALTSPGQQPWAFSYGAIAGDANIGRLLKVTRAHPKASWSEKEVTEKLHEQELTPKNTEGQSPKITGTPAVGVRLAVSNGEWSGIPVVYGYQWEDCNAEGKACTPILGALNENYTPTSSDVGHTLVAEVTATNGDGSVIASSAASTTVLSKAGAYTQAVDSGYSLNAVSCVPSTTDCVLSDSAGKALYATNVSTSASATWKSWSGPSGESPSQALACPATTLCLLADGKETAGGKLYYATSLGGSFSEAYSPSYGVDAISCVSSVFCVDGQDGYGYFRYSTSPASTSWTLEDQAEASMKGAFCLSTSFCALADGSGRVHVATSTSQIESSTWKETDVDGSSALNGIACTATTSCVAVDGAGNALKLTIESSGTATAVKHNIDGTTSLTAVTCTGSSTCVAVDASGNVFVSKNAGETWAKEYALGDKLTSVSCASTTLCATADTTGNVTAFNPAGGTGTSGESHAPQPGSTIEYDVPLSGSESSHLQNLTKAEVEKWGQKDDPVEAAAIFPPDEPQNWPASTYKRATVHYWDTHGRTVNTAVPTGGVATNEYNEANEVTRTLSADNRATVLKEECKSAEKHECKSAERSEKLDTKTEYNGEETNVLKVVGPEHKVKLSTGEEVQARSVTRDYYDEGAKQAEEKNKEVYDLLTKTTSGALLSSGEEKDIRTTATSYSGQEDLGWKLRKATSTTLEPGGLDLVHKMMYQEHENAKKEIESTGDVVETRAPAGNSEEVSPPSFSLHFGGSGSGNGQFKEPLGVALDASGNVWTLDTGNDRVEKFSSTGSFSAAYGKEGAGNLQFKGPEGIAVNRTTGNVYVADSKNNRIEELNSSGAFVETIGWGVSNEKAELEVCKTSCKAGIAGSGSGQFNDPTSLTIDSKGDLWVVDTGNNRIAELSEGGAFVLQFGSKGSGNGQFSEPVGIAISEGSAYVVDNGNARVEQFSSSGAYLGQFGSKGSGSGQFSAPNGIAVNPSNGDLYICDSDNNRMEEFSPSGKFLTEWGTWGSTHEQSVPVGVAVGATGTLYIIDPVANEVGEWIPPEAGGAHLSYSTQFGSKGTGNGQFSEPNYSAIDGKGNVWITDYGNDRLEEFTAKGGFIASYGKAGSGEVQFNGPAGVAINKSTGNIYVADVWNNRIEELSSTGAYVASIGTTGSGTLKEPVGVAIDSSGDVWAADRGNNRIVEFSSTGTYIAAYGKEGTGEVQFKDPVAIAFSGENVYVADSANHRVEELTNKGAYVRAWGFEGNGSGEFWTPESIATDAAGNLYVADINADHVEEFSSSGAFKDTFGSPGSGEGQFTNPEGVSIDAAGDLYVVDQSDNRIEIWDSNSQTAHDTKTIYYTAKEEASVATCRNHPEWANLPCQTEPVAQPDHGLPEVPVITIASYNIWEEAETTEEKFGTGSKAVTRTKTQTFDPAGRALTSEEKSSPVNDTALPKVTNEYNTATGGVDKQSTTEGTITTKDNTLGQLVESTDASGNVAKYVYEEGGDGRLLEESEGKGEEAKSSQAYIYNTTTGFMEKLSDSAAGTFTASYDAEGKMTSEVYPNNMTATYTINSLGQSTGLVYEKNADCASKCPEVWFSDGVVPSIHGETLQQTSTLSKENYAFNNAGQLQETQETPAGKGCTTRLYTDDEEANRTSQTTREPGTEGKCATEGGTTERHTYDEANRLTDEGVEYEAFSNTTKLPASDAGGHELLSSYYVDGQVAAQEQNKELINYKYDPAGRTSETVSENKETKAKTTMISHYGSGSASTWTSEGTEKWTREIAGIDGGLDAIQESGKGPLLQLHDLQGNIVGTVADSESETKLLSTYNSTEFGVPTTGSPPKYSWLGADGVASELTATGVSTQDGASYVPEIGRPLQTGAIASPGSFPNGTGGAGIVMAPYLGAASTQLAAAAAQQWAEKEEAKKREAEERAFMEEGFCEKYPDSSACHVDGPGEGNCEVNCLTIIGGEEQETLGVGFESGSGNASEAKYFDHEVTVSKFIAGELGNAIFWTNHLGPVSAGFFHVPSWLIQAVSAAADAKLVGGLDQLSANLLTAGSLASGPVTIHAYGDLKGYFWIDVDFPVDVGVDGG